MIPTTREKKKRVSKKNKASWRKHTDIRDVDEFLEEQRLEERLGEALSGIKNEDLFTIDQSSNKEPLTAKERKRLRLAAPPKCFSMLQPHTKVPDPIIKRNRLRTREERICPILKRKENERKLKGILKYREYQSISDRKKHEAKLKEKENDGFTKDVWNIQNKLDQDEWIEKLTKRHILRGTGKLNKVSPKLKIDKNTAIPNIEIPHPGTSYNPSFKDHTDLLVEVAKKETKIIKEEEHINRVTKNMFKKVSAVETDNIWLKEMSHGLPAEEHSNDENETDVGDGKPYKSVNAPVENKKKTTKQRRKQKEQLLLMERQLLAKLEKKKSTDIHKLKTINVQIENLEKKLEKQKLRKEKLKTFKSKEPKQLGRLKYDEPDTVFSMKDDLSGNLRNLKVKGNLLSDRFTSFQKRNILAVTARHNRRKSKVKKFVKPGFKDDWKQTVASTRIIPTRK